jgi:hypothetical protein
MNIDELLHAAADAAPQSRIDAQDVLRRSRRVRHARLAVRGGAGVAVAGALVLVLTGTIPVPWPDVATVAPGPAASGTTPVVTDPEATPEATPDATEPGVAPLPSEVTPVDEELPFTAYAEAVDWFVNNDVGATFANSPEMRAAWDNRQAVMTQCMADAGFEWPHFDYPSAVSKVVLGEFTNVIPLPYLSADRTTVEQFGYGTDDVGTREAELVAGNIAPEPLGDYMATLSEADQIAFTAAMGGDNFPDSCAGQAWAQYPDPVNADLEAFRQMSAPYFTLIYSMQEVVRSMYYVGRDVATDPRVSVLNAEWKQCMLDAGVDVMPPPDSTATPAGAPSDAYHLAIITGPDGVATWLDGPAPVTDVPIENRYLTGTEAERRIALADHDCRAATDYLATFTAILIDLERTFVAEHEAELDQMLTIAGESR